MNSLTGSRARHPICCIWGFNDGHTSSIGPYLENESSLMFFRWAYPHWLASQWGGYIINICIFLWFFWVKKKSMMLSSPDIAPINHTHHRLSETVLRYSGNIVVTEDGSNTARIAIWLLRPYGGSVLLARLWAAGEDWSNWNSVQDPDQFSQDGKLPRR